MKKSNEEKTYATLKLGKTYKFAGYNWMACEVDNDRHVVVIQSHGVTHGAWPGYTMPQFGNGNYYSNSIDGKDISDYDDKMRALYDDIKDAEDKAAPYGEGLYLISVEKAEFKEWDNTGSGNYWQALPIRSGMPITLRGSVLTMAAKARGVLTRMAASTTTSINATTLLLPHAST